MRWRERPLQELATWLVEGVAGIYPWLKSIESKLEKILSNQDVVNAYAQQIVDATTELGTELAALKAAVASGEVVSFDGLDTAVKGLQAIETPVVAPPVVTPPVDVPPAPAA